VKLTADTNVLLRAILGDDPSQTGIARQTLTSAEIVVVTTPTLCELAWVLDRTYRQSRQDIAKVIRALLATENFVVNASAAGAGVALLEAGGDFADGVIAFDGRRLGGDTFATFDKDAATLVERSGNSVLLLAAST
jgi:predicted nucleic-acid-binding protein